MTVDPVYVVVGFAWCGDMAIPVEAIFVADLDMAWGLVEQVLDERTAIAAYEIRAGLPSLIAAQATVPHNWLSPTLEQILAIKPA